MTKTPRILRNHTIDGELFPLIVTTFHGDAVATTAIHGGQFGRHIGGVRFVAAREGDWSGEALNEVAHLASTMSEKCAAASIRADGQKSVVVTKEAVLEDEDRKVAVLTEHARAVAGLDPTVIFGPDMKSAEAVQDRAALTDGLLDHFTGLSTEQRGLSIDSNGYTAQGLAQAILTCVGRSNLSGTRVTIQGFGAVGAHTAHLLHGLGARIVAVSDVNSLIVGDAIDIPALFNVWKVSGNIDLRDLASQLGIGVSANPIDILGIRTDIFVPAARTAILACGDELLHIRATENPDARDVADFFDATGAGLVVEGANHPLSLKAELWLESRGVRVLPDFIVNCGGLIGCWVEWEARHLHKIQPKGDLARMGETALARIRETVARNVQELMASNSPAREVAAEIVARNRAALCG